jgi:hypothetical protein
VKVDPEPADAGNAKRSIGNVNVPVHRPRVRRQRGKNSALDVYAVERAILERMYAAVYSNRGGRAGDEQEIAAAARRYETEPAFEAQRLTGCRGSGTRGIQFQDQPVDLVALGHHAGYSSRRALPHLTKWCGNAGTHAHQLEMPAPGDTDRCSDLDRNRGRMVTFATRRAMREFPVPSPAVAARAVTRRRKLHP